MEFHYKIIINGNVVPFNDAINKKYILLTSSGFSASDDVQINEWSGLYDTNYNEIFANDILRSENGKRYIIEHFSGTFFLKELNGSKGSIPLALSSLKFGNIIDNMHIE